MSIYIILTLISGILTLLLGLFVLGKNRKLRLNQVFFFFALSCTIWLLGSSMMLKSKTDEEAIFWDRIVYIGVVFIPTLSYHISLLFTKTRNRKYLLFAGYFLSSLFFILSRTDYFVTDLYKYSWGFHTQARFFHHIFLIFFIVYFVLFFLNVYRFYRKTKAVERSQAAYFLLASFLMFLSSLAFLSAYGINLPPFSYFTAVVFVFILTLAITRYHLFGIRVILTELLVGGMGLIWLVFSFLMPTVNLRILTFLTFFLFCIFGYYLIKATHEEEKRKEEAERMAVQERALRLRTERLTRARDQFILSSQHYFRTPLTSIIGFLEMVLDESYGKLPEKVKEKLGLTSRSVLELRKRIEESLDISQFQIRKGKGILSLEEVRVEDLIKNVIEELKPQAKEKNLYLEVSFPENPLPKMKLDKKRMFMVFVNLIDNGIKHTLKGGIKLFLEYLKDKNSILFSVKDTGIGIPREELPFIGQMPFERGRKAKELTPLGKGIGLYLSRLVVEAHGGKLWTESEGIGKGSVFYIELPVK